jgi:nucleotide-binding universal stress UspA family protein
MQPNTLNFSHILCAADFSTPAQAAFQQALSLAKAHNAQLSPVFAVPLNVGFNSCARERINLLTEFRKMGDAEGVSISASVQQGERIVRGSSCPVLTIPAQRRLSRAA